MLNYNGFKIIKPNNLDVDFEVKSCTVESPTERGKRSARLVDQTLRTGAWLTVDDVADKAGVSKTAAQRIINAMAKLGTVDTKKGFNELTGRKRNYFKLPA